MGSDDGDRHPPRTSIALTKISPNISIPSIKEFTTYAAWLGDQANFEGRGEPTDEDARDDVKKEGKIFN